MKFLLDQNLSHDLVAMLNSLGHDTIHVSELGLASAEDDLILATAKAEGRILVSADTDFGALLALSNDREPSVILFRTRLNRRVREQFTLLVDLLPLFEEDLSTGCVVVISDETVRVRRLPLLGD